jgi:hypothetical protein
MRNTPGVLPALDTLLERAKHLNLSVVAAQRSIMLKWTATNGAEFTLAGITENGDLVTYSVGWVPDTYGVVELAHEYLRDIARIADAEVWQTPVASWWHLASEGAREPDAMALLVRPEAWLSAIEAYVNAIGAELRSNR